MYIFKEYPNGNIQSFKSKKDFFNYLDTLCNSKDPANQNGCKYMLTFDNDEEYITYNGLTFGGFSLGWDSSQQRFKLLGYWTYCPCKD